MDEEKFNAGAVWHGPWHTGLVSGSFGAPDNYHWAMAFGKHVLKTTFPKLEKAFFPFTSKPNNKAILILPQGTTPFGRKNCRSFLLPIRLIVRKTDLAERFNFTTLFPDKFYQEAVQNYKNRLASRKKFK